MMAIPDPMVLTFVSFVHALPVLVLSGIAGIAGYYAWGLSQDRKDAMLTARRQALNEARAALLSLADIAERASRDTEHSDEFAKRVAYTRSYYYGRAAMIVGSIPLERK